MKQMKVLNIASELFVLLLIMCSTAQVEKIPSKEANVVPLVEKIITMNTVVPETIIASYRIESIAKNSFKATARLQYNVSARKAKISIVDSIFGTHLGVVILDATNLYIYQPIEKNLLIFHYNRFPVNAFLPIDVSVEIIDDLIVGKIPILKNYYNAKAVESESEQYVLLESDTMYQTIVLKNDIPQKILFIAKGDNRRYEIYFIKPKVENNIFTCKAMRLVDTVAKVTYEITIQQSSINEPIPDTITELKFPRDTKINDYR